MQDQDAFVAGQMKDAKRTKSRTTLGSMLNCAGFMLVHSYSEMVAAANMNGLVHASVSFLHMQVIAGLVSRVCRA